MTSPTDPLSDFDPNMALDMASAQAISCAMQREASAFTERSARARAQGVALACAFFWERFPRHSISLGNSYAQRFSDSDPETQTLDIAIFDGSGSNVSHASSGARADGKNVSYDSAPDSYKSFMRSLLNPFYTDTHMGLDTVGRLIDKLPAKMTRGSEQSAFAPAYNALFGAGSWEQWIQLREAVAERSALNKSAAPAKTKQSKPRV